MSKPKPVSKIRKGRVALLVIIVILALGLMGLGGGYWWYSDNLKPVSTQNERITVRVEEGEGSSTLIADLYDKGLIRSKEAAKLYLQMNKGLGQYAGYFELSPAMSTAEIFSALANPDNAKPTYAVVTIPEGTWAKDIARIIDEAIPDVSADELLKLWNDPQYIQTLAASYPFLDPAAINNDQFFVKLEGYLFPETYHMDYTMNADQITRMILDQFGAVYQKNKAAIDASSMSLEQILTLASIIQFESGNPADMPTIAGVFANRLAKGMPLQSSVTVCYALYDQFNSNEDCERQYDIDSPYNTYKNPGLPIGPILNPGEAAIQAALNPEKNDYLYFVADIHGDGSVHYAKTYEEHQANVEKYNLVLSD